LWQILGFLERLKWVSDSVEVSPAILICENQKTLRRFRILSDYDLDAGNKISDGLRLFSVSPVLE